MSSEKSTLSAKTSQTSFSHLSTAEKVFEQSKKNFDLKTGQASKAACLKSQFVWFLQDVFCRVCLAYEKNGIFSSFSII